MLERQWSGFSESVIENGLNGFALGIGGRQAMEIKRTDKIQLSQILLLVLAKGLTCGKLKGKT